MDVTSQRWQPGPMRSQQRFAAPAALAVTVLLWGSAFAAIREAVPALGWEHLSVLRLSVAALALAAFATRRRVGWPARRDLPLLALCALSGMTAYQVFLNAGEVTVPAATASLLVNVAPIFTALMAVAVLGERLPPAGWCGVGLGFTGAAVIAVAAGGGARLSPGALLVLGAALAQATFFVSQKALLRRHGSLAVTAWAMGLGAAIALPLAPGLPGDVASAPPSALLAVAFLAFGASALGFLTWAYAAARVEVTVAAATLYAVPPVAALVGWLVLGEVPSALTALGGAIALCGVAITARSRRTPPAAERPPRRARGPAPGAGLTGEGGPGSQDAGARPGPHPRRRRGRSPATARCAAGLRALAPAGPADEGRGEPKPAALDAQLRRAAARRGPDLARVQAHRWRVRERHERRRAHTAGIECRHACPTRAHARHRDAVSAVAAVGGTRRARRRRARRRSGRRRADGAAGRPRSARSRPARPRRRRAARAAVRASRR
jgi:terminal-alkyne amino-acid exporter